MPILPLLAAILLPPLGVAMTRGIGRDFWINVALTLLGYIPGMIHAVWLVARTAPA